ncbi:putative set domain-containing protein [Eutypa lata UCREL1]|uniref:Putative set domain-containing protein n=1 Tax=Eutypa lata (strain UCR-EL1) TaxID=1287681 RepID=M7SNC5_EUTLA|nr:putative set domain-containing protein [Eutypa lata UCREL1]
MVRSTGTAMGDGLFATRDIKQGTTIFTESPILTVVGTAPKATTPTTSTTTTSTNIPDDVTTDLSAFCTLLRDLPPDTLRALDQLACNPAHVNPVTRARVRQWYKDRGMTNASGEVLKGKKLQDATKAPIRRFGIYLTNRVSIETTTTTTTTSSSSSDNSNSSASAVFPLYSRVNHSCIPNARRSWDAGAQQLTLYSVRDIRAGEQVLASYVSYACRTREQRARDLVLAYAAFACGCRACADPDLEVARQRSFFLSRGLGHYANPVARMVGAAIGYLQDYVPKTTAEALAWAEELVALLEAQGLYGPELCKILETGALQKALDYAYKEVDLGRCIVGTESEYLDKDAQDADTWVKHLQKERFRNLRQFWERGRF